MAADVDSDVPEWGAAFTFGKSRFSENTPGKFWIKNDPILQIACGDEHTAFLTASGRLFTFGNNEWGQLGHGHTKTLVKPSCVKTLKSERATIVACGRSHTLVATDSGYVYAFGSNSEGQLGTATEVLTHSLPIRVQGLEGVNIKMLCGGADHSMALTDRGIVYVWGSGSEGQIGPERTQISIPTELSLDSSVICISAGYYHSAFATMDGRLFTCGEENSGKDNNDQKSKKNPLNLHCVSGIEGKVVWVSCGGNHTVFITASGKAYSLGNGFNGQLGLGTRLVEATSAHLIRDLENVKVARVSCGENHTAFLTDTGQLYTCGNGRHGKLAVELNEYCLNQFVPTLVTRFCGFQVQQVACGGCHSLVLAVRHQNVFRPTGHSEGSALPKSNHLPPLSRSSTYSNRNQSNSSTIKVEYRQRLPSISKSPVWYVPLKDEHEAKSMKVEEEDEVLTRLECHLSALDKAESDNSIRHMDSDVDSDSSEVSELNTTHTLICVDDEMSLARPVIVETASTNGNGDTTPKFLEVNGTNESEESKCDSVKSTIIIENLSSTKESLHNPKGERIPSEVSKTKSRFYDDENSNSARTNNSSSQSLKLKSSSACAVV